MAAGERKKHEIKVPSDEINPDVVPTAVGECWGGGGTQGRDEGV